MSQRLASVGSFYVLSGVLAVTRRALKHQQGFVFPKHIFANLFTTNFVLGVSSKLVTDRGVSPTFLLGGKVKIKGESYPVLIASHSRQLGNKATVILERVTLGGETYENLVVPLSAITIENEKCLVAVGVGRENSPQQGEAGLELPFGVTLRQYQEQFIEVVLEAMQQGLDRGYIVAPWQVGKTLCLAPLIARFQERYPGKKVLIVAPSKIITGTIAEDLQRNFAGSISVVDGRHKDFSGDVVLASAFTLGRQEHVDKIDPKAYGLVVYDEANFSVAPLWVRILLKFGFLSVSNNIQKNPNCFLLGLTATPERTDRRHISQVFGQDGVLVMRSLPWFIRNGYLHQVEGVRVELEGGEKEALAVEGEILLTSKDFSKVAQQVLVAYKAELLGKKTLCFVARIEQADQLVEAFNREFGSCCAAAIHSDMDDVTVEAVVGDYVAGKVKVLVSINKLSYGFRAYGTEGIIHTYATNSWTRYAQRTGRALAVQEGEVQRTVTVVDMAWGGFHLFNPMNIPRLFGLADYPEHGRLKPLVAFEERQSSGFALPSKKRQGSAQVPGELRFDLRITAGMNKVVHSLRFGEVLRKLLETKFDFDVLRMAWTVALAPDQLDRYLTGDLPSKRSTVMAIAEAAGEGQAKLLSAWVEDRLEIVSKLFPMPAEAEPEASRLTDLVRRLVVTASEGSVASLIEDRSTYMFVLKIMKGEVLPLTTGQYEKLQDLFYSLAPSLLDKFEAVMRALVRVEIIKNPDNKYLLKLSEQLIDAMDFAVFWEDLDGLTTNSGQPVWNIHVDVDLDREPDCLDSVIQQLELSRETREVLKSLLPNERAVLSRLFGIGGEELSPMELTVLFGYERSESIYQIREKALCKLRHPVRSDRLLYFYNMG